MLNSLVKCGARMTVGLPLSSNTQASLMHWVGVPSTPGAARLLIFLIAAIISSTVKGDEIIAAIKNSSLLCLSLFVCRGRRYALQE